MKKLFVLEDGWLKVDDLTVLEVHQGELFTLTNLKYDFGLRNVDEIIEQAVNDGLLKWVEVKKSRSHREIKATNAQGKQFTCYSQKKVKLG